MRYSRLFIIFVLFSGSLFAQLNKRIEISSQYDNNLFRSPDPVRDFLTNVDFRLNYQLNNSNLNYYYNGNMFLYQENTLRNFYLHNIGLNYYKSFGHNNKHVFYFGAEGALRTNGDYYNYFDYNQVYAYSNFRFDLNLFFVRGGYNFRYRNYLQMPDLTNFRHYLFLQINKSFSTRTTLIMEADLGNKVFSGKKLFTTSWGAGHGGKGYGADRNNAIISTTTSSDVPSLNHLVLLTRVTQSLFDKMGLYLQYRQQISLTGETTFVNADGYYQDEELFDDPFSYESQSWSSQLTWMLSGSLKLQVGGTQVSKNYVSEQAFISADDSLAIGGSREDNTKSYYVNFNKTFYVNKKWLKSFQFYLNCYYIKNKSNSYWYDYKNSVWGGGVKWLF